MRDQFMNINKTKYQQQYNKQQIKKGAYDTKYCLMRLCRMPQPLFLQQLIQFFHLLAGGFR